MFIFSIHWGGNWGYDIPSGRRRFARDLIDRAGADVVHGNSSHHPLGIEVHNGKLILYGCGDFINDYEGIGGHEDTARLEENLDRECGKLGTGVARIEAGGDTPGGLMLQW